MNITFSGTKPTSAGAYWWRSKGTKSLHLIEITEVNGVLQAYSKYRQIPLEVITTGEWSDRLIPCGRLNMAYMEGWMDSDKEHPEESEEQGWHNWDWAKSKTKREMDGVI